VEGIEQDDRGITLHGPGTLAARYVVACDGGHSSLRKLLGLAFPGVEAKEYFTMADIRLSAGEKELPEIGERWDATTMRRLRRTDPDGSTANLIPFGQLGNYRLLYNDGRTARDEVTSEQLADAIQRFWGDDYVLRDVMYAGRFGDGSRQLENYRAGRVFFAGDAAHIHLPAGGQGLNLGVQDAFNLGWELAVVVNGTMPDALLDSYNAERHPVGARVLDNTRAQNALRNPDLEHQALLKIVAGLLAVPEANKATAAMISGLDIDYGGQGHVGTHLPDFQIGTAWASELFHGGTGVLLTTRLADVAQAEPWADRVRSSLVNDLPWAGVEALLIRPDGYVCWTAPGAPVETALKAWFGSSEATPVATTKAHP
jgi:2-polyprenyl-6-methoxyphenol hydroxylase-like FAD-dependent oxidoreductase